MLQVHYVCVFVLACCTHIRLNSILKGLTDSSFDPPLFTHYHSGWWHTGCHDTRLFCLPFDLFKGCCGQSGITCEGQREGRRGRGKHFLCKNEVQKVPLYIRFVQSRRWGASERLTVKQRHMCTYRHGSALQG